MQEAVIAPLFTKANANLITDGVEGIEFHPVALNRVYKRPSSSNQSCALLEAAEPI